MRADWKLAAGALTTAAALGAAGLTGVPASATPAPSAAARSVTAIATSAPIAPCYDSVGGAGATVPVSLTGGTPGDSYQVDATYPGTANEPGDAGNAEGSAPFDARGDGSVTLTGIHPDLSSEGPITGSPVVLSALDTSANGDTETAYPIGSTDITNRAISVDVDSAAGAALPHRVAVSGTQFAGHQLDGFVLNTQRTRILLRFSLGVANRCGFAERDEDVVPRHFSPGTYWMYVNAGPKLKRSRALDASYRVGPRPG